MEIRIPEVGESIHEVVVARWTKKDGDTIKRDELLCELETDKVALEIHAEVDGVLHIDVAEGQTVNPGAVIGRIEESDADKAKEPVAKEEKAAKKEAEPKAAKAETVKPAPASKAAAKTSATSAAPTPAPASPPPPAAITPRSRDFGPVERKAMTPIRKRIAERLLAARQQTAMLTTFNEADMGHLLALREKHQAAFTKKHGVKLGFMSFFVKAVVKALGDWPMVNARIDGDDIVYHQYTHISIAIGTERGLVVPVVRDADQLTFAQIEQQIAEFAEKAQSGKLELSDLEGGTFSISNGGVYGSLLSTPIINPPQSAILGMHAVQKRPVVIDDEIVIRPMMNLALSYDHRIIDGREAVGFLKQVKEYIEDPEELLLES